MRASLLIVLLASCGGSPHVERTAVEPLPPPPVVAQDAAAPKRTEPTCLDPLEGGKPVDQAKLDAAARLAEPEKSFARGRAYLEADHWVEAANAFRSVAFLGSDSEITVYAAQMYLECLNHIGQLRVACYDDDFPSAIPRLIDVHCTSRRSKNEEACIGFERIQFDLERLRAQRMIEEADKTNDVSGYRKAADAYLAIFRARCATLSPQYRCDEIAFNAGATYLAANDAGAARGVYTLMVDPKNKIDKSVLTVKLACRLGIQTGAACR